MANRREKGEVTNFIFLSSQITADGDCSYEIKRHLLLERKAMTNLDILESRDHFIDKGPFRQTCSLSSSHELIWELYLKEGWAPKNWCFWIVALEKTLDCRPLDCKIKPASINGHQPWIVIGRTDAESEALTLWLPDVKSWLTGKDPDAGKDWKQKKRVAEDEMVRYNHHFNGHEFEQTPGDCGGQRSLVCCSPWTIIQELATEQ